MSEPSTIRVVIDDIEVPEPCDKCDGCGGWGETYEDSSGRDVDADVICDECGGSGVR